MKKKILSLMLSIAVVFSFVPLFTVQADAASSNGATTLLKTKTVTIKPGKTYKSPKFKLTKKQALQAPIYVTLPNNETDEEYKLKFTLSFKNEKGKNLYTYKCPAQTIFSQIDGTTEYSDWIYCYDKSISKPGYAKGKYYITIKNTSKKTIKVKVSVKGYTKFATTASVKKSLTIDGDTIQVYAGKVGKGMPLIKSVKSSNKNVPIYYYVTYDGKIYLCPDPFRDNSKKRTTTVTITLKNGGKQYKIKVTDKPVVYD